MLICIYSLWEQFCGSWKRESKRKQLDFNFHTGQQFCFQMKSLWAAFYSTLSKRCNEISCSVERDWPKKSQIADSVNRSAALPNNRIPIQLQKIPSDNIHFLSNLYTHRIFFGQFSLGFRYIFSGQWMILSKDKMCYAEPDKSWKWAGCTGGLVWPK